MSIRTLLLAVALLLPFGSLSALTEEECAEEFAKSDASNTCHGDSSGGGDPQFSVAQTARGDQCRIQTYCRDYQPTSVNGALSTTAVWEYNDITSPKHTLSWLQNCRGDLKFQCL